MDRRTLIAITAASLVSATLAVVVPRVLATGAPTQSPLVYAGTVTDEGGKPYPQAVDVALALFDKTDATVPKCQAPTVKAEAGTGRFAVVLPGECAMAVHAAPDLWVQATVNGKALAKTHIAAVPYALETAQAAVAVQSLDLKCKGCVGPAEMAFDQDLDLQGYKLKTGPGGAVLEAGKLDLGAAAGDELTSANVKTLTGGGNADVLHTHAGGPGGGGGGQVIKFKGVTSVAFDGGKGLHTMNAQCAKDFGAARICTTEGLAHMYPAPTPAAKAWVLAEGPWVTLPNSAPQAAMILNGGPATYVNCGGVFTTKASEYAGGHALDTNGALTPAQCSATYPAACCGP